MCVHPGIPRVFDSPGWPDLVCLRLQLVECLIQISTSHVTCIRSMMQVPMSGSPWPGIRSGEEAYLTAHNTQKRWTSCVPPLAFGPQLCRSLGQTLSKTLCPVCPFSIHHATLIQFNSICTKLRHEPTKPPLQLGPPPLQLRIRPYQTANFQNFSTHGSLPAACLTLIPARFHQCAHSRRVEGGPARGR